METKARTVLSARQKMLAALSALAAQRPLEQIAAELHVAPEQVRQWALQLEAHCAPLFDEDSAPDRCTNYAGSPRMPVLFAVSPLAAAPTACGDAPCALAQNAPDDTAGVEPQRSRDKHHAGTPDHQDWLENRVVQLSAKYQQLQQTMTAALAQHQRTEAALRQSEIRLHELLAHQDKIKEEERKRMAREIHDELGQNLLTLRIDISSLHARTARHCRLHEWSGLALQNVDTTIKSVRTLINDLRPFALELGLPAAVEWQVSTFARSSGIPHHLQIDEASQQIALPDDQALAVFRVLQEALANVTRHSLATQVDIALGVNNGVLRLSVADNGVGVFPADRRKSNSFGLIGMRERIGALGGEFMLDSGIGSGTTVTILVPLK